MSSMVTFKPAGQCLSRVVTALVVMASGLAAAQERPAVAAYDVITEDSLRQKVAATPSLKSQLEAQAKPVVGRPPAVESSLWATSIIISDGEKYTLVPVGSILHLPASLRAHVVAKPQGDFTFWPNFLKRNSSWLAGHEVSLGMSRGNAREAKELFKSIATDPRLLVAVYKGGPITILEPAEESSAAKKP